MKNLPILKTGNAMNMHFTLYLCLFLNLLVSALTYTIPDPKVELLSPKGIRISIPHENGIALVGYHININKPIALLQPGDYAADITNPTDGRWIFDITNAFIDPGHKINFWIHVQYGSYAFRKLGSEIASGDAVNISEPTFESTSRPTSRPTNRPTSSTIPLEEDPIIGSCEESKTTMDRKSVCKGELIFEDNFNSLNWTKWKREVKIPLYSDDAEFVSFQTRDENCYVSNGQLHIVPNLLSEVPGFSESSIRTGKLDLGSDCTGIIDISEECTRDAHFSRILPPVVSARIRTKDFFSFRYGKVEVRAKMPRGDWLFPLILLEPIENYYGFTGYASGQMRVAFIRGNEFLNDKDDNEISGYRISGGVVLSARDALRDIWLKGSVRRTHLGNDFHTYTLTWTDELISLEIDNNEYATIRGGFSRLYTTQNLKHAKLWDNGDAMAPFDREFFLTLGVSVGGHSDFPDGVLNGFARLEKPWKNEHPKAELQFWNDRENWLKTWNGDNAGLHVDYIRVYALKKMKILLRSSLVLYLILALVERVKNTEFTVQIQPIKGFTLSFPHEYGITNVEIHGSVNKQISVPPGEFSKIIGAPLFGKWTYVNKETVVPVGKQIFFWIRINSFVERKKVEYIIETPGQRPQNNLHFIHIGESKLETTRTTVNGKSIDYSDKPIFEDNFYFHDWSKWEHEIGIPISENDGDFVSFQQKDTNLYVQNGILYIVPTLLSDAKEFNEDQVLKGILDLSETCTGNIDPKRECYRKARSSQILPPVVSAKITTRNKFRFRYGKVEVRAKLPKGDWIFPIIALEPSEHYYGVNGYASGQLRIASARGNENLKDSQKADISGKRLNSGAVLSTGDSFHNNWLHPSKSNKHLGDDFHNYTVLWTRAAIILEIDGVKYGEHKGNFSKLVRDTQPNARLWENNNIMTPFDREFYLTLGVSVGGHSDFPDNCSNNLNETKPWNNRDPKAMFQFWKSREKWQKTWKGLDTALQIDYIRVYPANVTHN
ncbi:uncharacterized protein LOC129919334 [Episyrphus balteatus]|uniref:uncharacterized protein LOC129919334 n=1 Tax=Episyrphus balteatus TaxID=286459 RepID=UPI0024857A54|nr:uncharacterized protein LOC129919334 [Episyrphus balteatus]